MNSTLFVTNLGSLLSAGCIVLKEPTLRLFRVISSLEGGPSSEIRTDVPTERLYRLALLHADVVFVQAYRRQTVHLRVLSSRDHIRVRVRAKFGLLFDRRGEFIRDGVSAFVVEPHVVLEVGCFQCFYSSPL